MRIAQVAPLHESVPPQRYGGTERVVALLTDELAELGHEVALYATADSRTRGLLRSARDRAIRDDPCAMDALGSHFLMLEQVVQDAPHYDLIHFHTDYLHFPFTRRLDVPHVTTIHGRLDIPELKAVYRKFSGVPLVSISDSQRGDIPDLNWVATIHHGIGPDELSLSDPRTGYLAFLGRIAPEKRPDKAIELALRVGMPIKLAAKVDPVDREYFESVVAPLLDREGVSYIGEVNAAEKAEFLQGATALLFPIDWPEPFGLVMIEAMASGTPVVAWKCGSVPEVVDEGVTGFVVESDEEAVAAIKRCLEFDRRACRARFEKRFLARTMTNNYVALYDKLINFQRPTEAVA